MKRHYYFKRAFPSKPVRQWLYKNFKKRIPRISLLAIFGLISSIVGVVFALVSKELINSATQGDREAFFTAAAIYAGLIIVSILESGVSYDLGAKLGYVLDKDLKANVFHEILESDFESISKYHTGEVVQRINSDVYNIYSSVLTIASSLVYFIVGLILASVVLFSMAPAFTLCIIPVCVLLAFIVILCQRDLKVTQKEVSKAAGRLNGFYYEIIEKLLIVQGMGIGGQAENKAVKLLDEKISKQKILKNLEIKMNAASNVFGYAGSFITLIWCANKVLLGEMDYGTLVAITALVSRIQGPIMSLPSMIPTFILLSACTERVLEVVKITKQDDVINEDPYEIYNDVKCLRSEKLSFAYPNQEERKIILDGLDMSVSTNEMTVFTGMSGCGKSTMLKLLLGIYKHNSGELYFEMKDGSRLPIDRSTRNLFSFAPQGNLILSGTIRENIMIARPEATGEELKRAVYVSDMEDYLKELPLGLDTELGENGAGLSEGQIQRINIARAVLKNAPILLLDEVTSSLDIETERRVLERIHALPDKTCIAVTHRPAALELSEAEVHFEDGKAVNRSLHN